MPGGAPDPERLSGMREVQADRDGGREDGTVLAAAVALAAFPGPARGVGPGQRVELGEQCRLVPFHRQYAVRVLVFDEVAGVFAWRWAGRLR
ncbi:hypothetical protein GCM10010245_87420 [Streptomyces spectabilis]|nr:hypothetical protein GCM10010245_87420 [Streptomyces spectabilis]